ncbi:gliding motility-associated C-terminal domain-containing protein, partial [Larkinella sp. VNQ87]|uniref:T9SS type B sorting domain-containing protein n=1 Tax=Larkinella sp. VNQ87 TaxID=3400921 RepID=UPI003C04BCF6
QNAPATGTFRWQTGCAHVRDEPYDIVFRVVDLHPGAGQTQLATLEAFRIKIYAPQPQNLTARPAADPAGRAIVLNWNAYACGPSALPTGTVMAIYRKEGCETETFDPCADNDQLVANGYTRIDTVAIARTSYTDNNQNQGLRRGVQYSYRIVVELPRPNNGRSAVSQQVCVNLPQQVPLITNVTVDSTFQSRGVITVRWTRPPGIDPTDGTGPFQYRLLRATGLEGTNFTPIATINTSLSPTAPDTVYTDRGLNTVDNAYRYRIEFYYTDPASGQLQRLDATENASSVRLTATPAVRSIQLSWQANVPWSNDNQTHRIYRSRTGPNGPFNRIADVPVQGPNTFTFTDPGTDTYAADGLQPVTMSLDSSYCYRVETVGRYAPPLTTQLLLNYSQGVCASPIDTTRPCPPRLAIDTVNCASLAADAYCNQTSFANTLSWQPGQGSGCETQVAYYRIYFAACAGQPLVLLDSVNALSYRHENLPSFAGCYEVRAVSRSGRESAASNRVCKDNCPLLTMPNVFTPNGDGRNDVFEPVRCARFVESAELTVVNRWGVQVYRSSDASLRWDGKNQQGRAVPGGLYLYQIRVKFKRLDCSAPAETIKGWVELLRENGGTN